MASNWSYDSTPETADWRIQECRNQLPASGYSHLSHKWFWQGMFFGKGTASAVSPRVNKDAGFSPRKQFTASVHHYEIA
jgi:hypothetical protein